MKRKIILSVISLFTGLGLFATTVVVTNSGNAFTPDEIHINLGDTVIFSLGSTHDVVEVSEATYDSNGNISNGGFTLPLGGGMLIIQTLGMHYYVCSVHASSGMKGKIEVSDATLIAATEISDPFHVWPNPFEDKIFVKGLKDVELIEIFDITGSVVYKSEFSGEQNQLKINPGKLEDGFYIMAIRQKGLTRYQKMVKD